MAGGRKCGMLLAGPTKRHSSSTPDFWGIREVLPTDKVLISGKVLLFHNPSNINGTCSEKETI